VTQLTCPICGAKFPLLDGAGRSRTRCPVCNGPLPDESAKADKVAEEQICADIVNHWCQLDEPAKAENPAEDATSSREPPPAPSPAVPPSRVPLRVRRLLADAEQMQHAAARSSVFRIQSTEGDPPELYRIEYRVHGLAPGPGGKPVPRDAHVLEIQLTSEYPRVSPRCKVLTPIFHPNIDPTTICVGDHWAAGERLVDLVVRIGEMIAYQAYNIKSPLDGEAAMWADLNQQRLPIDQRSLLPAEEGELLPDAVPMPMPEAAADPWPPALANVAPPVEEPTRRTAKPVRRPVVRRRRVGALTILAALLLLGAGAAGYVAYRDAVNPAPVVVDTPKAKPATGTGATNRIAPPTQPGTTPRKPPETAPVPILPPKGTLVVEFDGTFTEAQAMRAILKEGAFVIGDVAGRRNYLLKPDIQELEIGEYEIKVSEAMVPLDFSVRRFSIQRDGKVVVRVTLPAAVEIGPFEKGHTKIVTMVAFSPDNKTLASASEDGTAILWDLKTRKPIQPPLRGHKAGVLLVAYSPDGQTLATPSRDGTVILWDATNGQKGATLREHSATVSAAIYSPNGKTLATAGDDRSVKVRDATGKVRFNLEEHKQAVSALAFSPDGRMLVSAGGIWGDPVRGGEVKAWNPENGKQLWSSPGNLAGIWGVAFSPDGKTLAGACLDGTVRRWDPASGKELPALKGHNDRVIWVAYSPDGQTLASASYDGTVRLWDAETGKGKGALRVEGGVQRLDFSFDGNLLATAGGDGSVRLWRLIEPGTAAAALRQPFPTSPEHELLARRGKHAMFQGRPKDAVADFAKAVELRPDSADYWNSLTVSMLAAGDCDGYRRTCARMLERLGKAQRAAVFYRSVVLPDTFADSGQLLALAEGLGPRELGAANYRAGKYTEALRCFEESGKHYVQIAWDWLFMAMAHQHLGHAKEARQYLDRATSWIEKANRKWPSMAWYEDSWHYVGPDSWYWSGDLIEVDTLRREAETLINPLPPRPDR
jgi:WD40 repeat protein/ubiquitin-protein ligase